MGSFPPSPDRLQQGVSEMVGIIVSTALGTALALAGSLAIGVALFV